ncbi:hypothetical protein NBRC10513_001446 [Rhodotorula toruloides]
MPSSFRLRRTTRLPAAAEGAAKTDVAPSEPPPTGPTSLLHLPDELLDKIVELAWKEITRHWRLAPCRRLRSSYDRLRFGRLTLRVKNLNGFASAVQARPAFAEYFKELTIWLPGYYCIPLDAEAKLLNLCRVMVNLQQLIFEGVKCENLQARVLLMVCSPSFSSHLTVLSARYAPFLPNQIDLAAGILASQPSLQCLELANPYIPNSSAVPLPAALLAFPSQASYDRLVTLIVSLLAATPACFHKLARLIAFSPALAYLHLYHVPKPAALQPLFASLTRAAQLKGLGLSFAMWSAHDGIGASASGVAMAPYLGLFPSLEELWVGESCLVFDDETISFLHDRQPLESLTLLPGFQTPASEVLAGLKRLQPCFPRRICLDQEEEASKGALLDDYYSLDNGGPFPSQGWLYEEWRLPSWMQGARLSAYHDIERFATSQGAIVDGRVLRSLIVWDEWDEERQHYDQVKASHDKFWGND